jgi:Ser/Thr protein kinase RdoA (MazF antagonist)
MPTSPSAADQALASYLTGAYELRPIERGLINQTFAVTQGAERYVLQRVNPIFDPHIHDDIRAVTRRLSQRGLPTPTLVDSQANTSWVQLEDGSVWRLMTFVPGATFDRVQSAAQARAAAALVARFHDALDDFEHTFAGTRAGVHDTAAHLAALRGAVAEHPGHRLHEAVDRLATAIVEAAARLPPLEPLPPVVCHGDLKLNNIVFAGAAPPASERATCLIDLDTLGLMQLAHELGDAWRSWCNPAGEDDSEAHFDVATFEASWRGYAEARTSPLGEGQRAALLHSVEWISLELSARFAADALVERYFGWDASRFATRGDHNLRRAHSQWGLHLASIATRDQRARVLGLR